MRIGIDCRTILDPARGEYAGVGHYTYYLVKALLERDRENSYVLFFNEGKDTREFAQENVTCVTFPLGNYRRYLPVIYNHCIVSRVIAAQRLDVYHNPANTIPLCYFGASVITVHDMAIYRHPAWFPGRQLFATLVTVPLSIRRARRIITVSDNTRHDVHQLFGTPYNRMKTVFHGVENMSDRVPDDRQVGDAVRAAAARAPYFLFVGTIEPRKNLRRLIEAFALFLQANPAAPHRLIIAGGKGWKYRRIFQAARRSDLRGRVEYAGYLNFDEKLFLLQRAHAFVFPSLYEGFGMPVLEAMSAGKPVITSNVGSIPELVIDRALLIDPYSKRSIAQAMETSIRNPELVESLKKVGKDIAGSCTWELCAKQTLEVYKEAA